MLEQVLDHFGPLGLGSEAERVLPFAAGHRIGPRDASGEARDVALVGDRLVAALGVPAGVSENASRFAVRLGDAAERKAAEALLVQQDTQGRARDLPNPYEARTLVARDKQYTGEPITLNLKDAEKLKGLLPK